MNAELLKLADSTLKEYYSRFRHIRDLSDNLLDLQLISTCVEILDYFNAYDEFLFFKKSGDIPNWVERQATLIEDEVNRINKDFLKDGKKQKLSAKVFFNNQAIKSRLFLEKVRFVSFKYIEYYRQTELEKCQIGLSKLLLIVESIFSEDTDSAPYTFELKGFLHFWLGKSYRQQNFNQAREHLQNAKQAFTFASLAAQNKPNFAKGFHEYQIKRIYFVNLAEARLLLIERDVYSALVTIETALSFIPDTDLLAKAYGKFVRGTCKRVLLGREILMLDIKDLNDSLDCFLGKKGYPPSPRHAMNAVRELVIAYILLGDTKKAKETLGKLESLIESGEDVRFSKLQKKKGSRANSKWSSILPGLYSRIYRKQAKNLAAKAHNLLCEGEVTESLKHLEESAESLRLALDSAQQAIENSAPSISSNISDAFIIRGEANFYMRNFSAAEQDFSKAIEANKKQNYQISNITDPVAVHKNPEIAGIANIYLGKIKLIQGKLQEAIPYFSDFLSLKNSIHSKWIEELYDNCSQNLVIFDLFQFHEESQAKGSKINKKKYFQTYLLKMIKPMFKTQIELANFLEMDKGTVNRILNFEQKTKKVKKR